MSNEQQSPPSIPDLLRNQPPRVLVLIADGINCNEETAHAFKLAGGNPEMVHINQLRSGEKKLGDYQILAISGGFSYGDDIRSGVVLAKELETYLGDQIDDFVDKGGFVIGICNGMQVLTNAGLIPSGNIERQTTSMANNASGHFECRPVRLRVEEDSTSLFVQGLDPVITLQVAHGEGRFVADPATLQQIEASGLVVMRYADIDGNPTASYPDNPNGAVNNIAALRDRRDRILALMPHPERSVERTQIPNWRRQNQADNPPQGLPIFQAMVNHAK